MSGPSIAGWRAIEGPLFPRLPERTRLFRLFATHQDGAERFLAEPTIFGVADSYGVELTHPLSWLPSLSRPF